jgi:hypothetical protein
MPPTPPDSLQTQTLRTFTVLHHLRPNWGGQLILSLGLGPRGSALAIASNIAGAVCLSLEEDPATAHAALRSGACDFVVNTLDEAIRALKNEVRKHLPISVGLQGNYATILAEILERGLSPQLLVDLTRNPANAAALQTLHSQGSLLLDFDTPTPTPDLLSADAILQQVLAENHWHLETFPQPTSAALRAFDVHAVTLATDPIRSKWLHAAPRILPRESPASRSLWLTPAEREALIKSHPIDTAR